MAASNAVAAVTPIRSFLFNLLGHIQSILLLFYTQNIGLRKVAKVLTQRQRQVNTSAIDAARLRTGLNPIKIASFAAMRKALQQVVKPSV